MHRISKKVVTLHAKACENVLHFGKKYLFALGLQRPCNQNKAIWWQMPPDVRESGENPELYLQL